MASLESMLREVDGVLQRIEHSLQSSADVPEPVLQCLMLLSTAETGFHCFVRPWTFNGKDLLRAGTPSPQDADFYPAGLEAQFIC